MHYLAGVAWLAIATTSVAVVAVVARRRLVRSSDALIERLAEIVLGLGWLTVATQLLGSFGLFARGPLGIVLAAAAVGALRIDRRRTRTAAPSAAASTGVATVICGVAVVVQWLVRTTPAYRGGITSIDSREYHLPFAAELAHSGALWTLRFLWLDPVWSYYPLGGRTAARARHGGLSERLISPLLNLGWLAVALLAALCLGRQFGAGGAAFAATAAVLSGPTLALASPGSAKDDVQVIALLLAAVALYAHARGSDGVLVASGAAAGLALATKYTALAPVAAFAFVLVVQLARRKEVLKSVVVWIGAAAVTGGTGTSATSWQRATRCRGRSRFCRAPAFRLWMRTDTR